ncbi:capsule assembly Wzi family protein [Emticicia sp.]|uniref:capsule assembly Wzi family protein n=1 Tax=Emticicia sp. TaxID=1930953 RepID=UPI00374FEA70
MRLSLTILFGIFLLKTSAQSTYTPLNDDYSHLIERYEIKSGSLSNLHSNIKPVRRKDLVKLTTDLEKDIKTKLSKVDSFNLAYLQNDSWEWLDDEKLTQNDSKKSFLKHFLKKKSDFYNFQNKDADFHISPIFQFAFAHDNLVKNQPVTNTRGIEIRGTINKKLGFYTMLTDNQIVYPGYVREYGRFYDANPYEGFTKITNADSTKFGTDFFSARGYITFQALKSIQIQFGHDKNFIGSGIRSMILSDFSAPYLHLKITTQIGKFQYVNIFAQLINKQVRVAVDGTEQIPPKYFSLHHLSLNISKNLNVGLFETVIFGKRPIGFDINYLNPIIFLRFVEGHLGSVDNTIVGADFKYNFKRHFSLYGQLTLDEFNRKYFRKNNWWATKYATQIGMRYIDVLGVKNLDFQAEYNLVRPYTYSHNSTYSNYINYNLPLAHPLGSNFKEALFVVRYQPINRLFLNFTAMLAKHGEDFDNLNWGGNILRNYLIARPRDYGNVIGQGNLATIRHLNLGASYMLQHNLFIDLKLQNRSVNYTDEATKSTIFSLGFRWNSPQRALLL